MNEILIGVDGKKRRLEARLRCMKEVPATRLKYYKWIAAEKEFPHSVDVLIALEKRR